MLDMTGLDDGFPVIGEIPKCSILISYYARGLQYMPPQGPNFL